MCFLCVDGRFSKIGSQMFHKLKVIVLLKYINLFMICKFNWWNILNHMHVATIYVYIILCCLMLSGTYHTAVYVTNKPQPIMLLILLIILSIISPHYSLCHHLLFLYYSSNFITLVTVISTLHIVGTFYCNYIIQ